MYKYFTGKHPYGADQVDYAGEKVKEITGFARDKAGDYSQTAKDKIGDATSYGQHKTSQALGTAQGYGGQIGQTMT